MGLAKTTNLKHQKNQQTSVSDGVVALRSARAAQNAADLC